MATLHKIKAYLYDNVLTENPNDFVARVISERSLNVKDICESATTRGGADISASTMEYAVSLWLKEMGYNLCDGFSINAGWFVASPVIRGVFDSATETFNFTKHTVLFDFHQGSMLRKELEQTSVEILGVAVAGLFVAQVTDIKTASVNDLLTPNRNLKITGQKLKIVGDNEANGVYFINQATQERTKVAVEDIVVNNPTEVIIMTPALATGQYKLEVVTQYAGTTPLKVPRTALFDKVLTV